MKWFKIASVLTILFASALFTTACAGDSTKTETIIFQTSTWSETLALAKKEKKIIFLDISASWCGPCKRLKSNTFTNVEVGEFYNANFINVAVDGEVDEGVTLAQKYQITGYPSLLFIDGDGNVVARTAGYHNPEEFLKLGNAVKEKTK